MIALHPLSCLNDLSCLYTSLLPSTSKKSTTFLLYFIFIFFPGWVLAEQLKRGEHSTDNSLSSSVFHFLHLLSQQPIHIQSSFCWNALSFPAENMHRQDTLRTVKDEAWSEHAGNKVSLSNSQYVFYAEDATGFCVHFLALQYVGEVNKDEDQMYALLIPLWHQLFLQGKKAFWQSESFRLEKTSVIIEFNLWLISTLSTWPWH